MLLVVRFVRKSPDVNIPLPQGCPKAAVLLEVFFSCELRYLKSAAPFLLQLVRQTGKSSVEVTFRREDEAKAARANVHR